MGKIILAIVGQSGSGKTTLVESYRGDSRFNVIDSYTTRKPRHEGETGHIFSTASKYANTPFEDLVADTFFNGSTYWSDIKQFKDDAINLYIVDKKGLCDLLTCRGFSIQNDKIISVFLECSERERYTRMSISRGEQQALERIEHDREAFNNVDCDFYINSEGLTRTMKYNIEVILSKYLQRGA